MVTKLVANSGPPIGIERDGSTRGPIFAIQINTCQDRTNRVETATNKFRVRYFQPLTALSMAAKKSIWFDRFRASSCADPNVGMIVGPDRQNTDQRTISIYHSRGS
jgi:hypothetical protein